MEFPDPDDIMNFTVTLKPDEVVPDALTCRLPSLDTNSHVDIYRHIRCKTYIDTSVVEI